MSPSSDPAKSPNWSWSYWKGRINKRWWLYPTAIAWAPWWVLGLLNDRLPQLPLFLLLEQIAVLIVAVFWLSECDDRTKERHYRAWELINAARGSTGDGGRRDALQDLNRDRVSLAAAPLEKAYLPEVDLKGADLQDANFQGSILRRANLEDADLWNANLQGADLGRANLQGANLSEANLQGASLSGPLGANLEGANLWKANLQGADLNEANLHGANLSGANLQDAYIAEALLQAASFSRANLRGAELGGADLTYASYLTQEQLDAANGDDETVLPAGLTRPAHWSKAEGSEGQPATQPDDGERAPAEEGAPGPDK